MTEHDAGSPEPSPYPVTVQVNPALEDRNRITTFFRFFLALPHVILVGMPVIAAVSLSYKTESHQAVEANSGGGILGAVAVLVAFLAWWAILLTLKHPDSLWKLKAWYLRWRVRAVAYMTLLRDEYPPFGDADYPARLLIEKPEGERNWLTVFFRIFLAIPHMFVLAFLGIAWAFTTAVAWAVILFTGRFPESLYGFALGVFAWNIRVEAYVLLLRDEYPPFTLRT